MAANSLEPRIAVVDHEVPDKTLHRKILKAIQAHLRIDAALFATYSFMTTGLEMLKSMNLVIPVHLAVVGFDDSPHFSFCSPPVTAIAQPINRIASEIARLAFDGIQHSHQEVPPENIVLETELIIRNSSC